MPLYQNLPGMDLTIKDGNLVLPAEDTGTESILIIAPITETGRPNLTDNEGKVIVNVAPQRIKESQDFLTYSLGTFDKDNPAARYWKQTHDAGCREIYIQELRGTTSEERYENLHEIYSTIEENFLVDNILLGGIYADDEITSGSVALDEGEDFSASGFTATAKEAPVIETFDEEDTTIAPYELPLTSPIIFSSIEVNSILSKTSIALTVDAENNIKYPIPDSNGIISVSSVYEDESLVESGYTYDETQRAIIFDTAPSGAITADYTVTNSVSSDSYGVDKDERIIRLEEAIETDETISISYDTYDYNFAEQLAGFCSVVTAKNNQVLGFIALKPATDNKLSTIRTYIRNQVAQKYNRLLQVIGGPTLMFEIANQPYECDFTGAYAGMISTLPCYSSPANKVIPGAIFPSFNLSPSQALDLTNKHIVVPRTKNGRIYVADAITTASDESDFVRLTSVRIVDEAVKLVREIAEPYIGEPNTITRRNSLETAINTALRGMIRRGALNDFRFTIKASLADQIKGDMKIILDLVPVFETRRIFITVAMKPSL